MNFEFEKLKKEIIKKIDYFDNNKKIELNFYDYNKQNDISYRLMTNRIFQDDGSKKLFLTVDDNFKGLYKEFIRTESREYALEPFKNLNIEEAIKQQTNLFSNYLCYVKENEFSIKIASYTKMATFAAIVNAALLFVQIILTSLLGCSSVIIAIIAIAISIIIPIIIAVFLNYN